MYLSGLLFCSVDLCVCFRARSKLFCFAYYSFLIQFEISKPSLELYSSFPRSVLSLVFCDLIQQNRPRRDGKNTQKNYTKKYPNDPDNHNGVVSHLARYYGMWTPVGLKNTAANKASGSDRIPTKLFKILKVDAIKVLHSICQKILKSQQWPEDWKRSILIPIPKKDSIKECSSHWTYAVISSASKVMIKIFLASLQHYVNLELPDVHLGFRKGRGTRDQIGSIWWNIEKSKEFQKTICFINLTELCGSQQIGKFLRWEYQTNLICLLRKLYADQTETIRSRQGTINWFKIGEGVCQGWILSITALI